MIVNLVWNLSAIVNFFFFQCLKYWYCVNLILIKLIFINTCHFHICYIFVDFFFSFSFSICFWLFESEFTLPAYIHTYNFDDLSINSSHLKISKYLQVNKLFHIDVLNILMGFLHPALYFSIIMIIFIYLYMAKNWTNRIQFSCYVL